MNGMRRNRRCHEKLQPVTNIFYCCCIACVVLLFTGCAASKRAAYKPSDKIAAAKLKEDFSLLKKILEANHPSLYWYTPKDSVDHYFNEAYESIRDSMTEFRFRNKVAWFISKLKCGHTSVRPSQAYSDYYTVHKPARFPLLIKTWNDSLVYIGSLNRQDTLLDRGTVITSIENLPAKLLLDSMFHYISTDGDGDNFKSQAISFNFPLYYSFAFPLKDSFAITYVDSGIQQSAYVKLNKPVIDTAGQKKPAKDAAPRPNRRQIKQMILLSKRSMIFDTVSNLAYMRLNTFSGGRLRSFFRQSFKDLAANNIQNLVIDLRENSGGNINLSMLLTRYLKQQPFHTADTAIAVNRPFSYTKYIHPALPYNIAMRFATAKKTDGRYHFGQLEKHAYKPFTRHHYDHPVYIVQGGYTFSAAAMFVLQLKGQQNVTVLGEETGGGNYGTSAVHLPDIVLPNSKVRVVLPLYRLVFDTTQTKNGKGIQPDVYVPPSSEDIKNGVDPKLKKVKELIEERRKQ
ncbi:peptidase S41 [Panacibacter sp. DH6]|uniref:Peptidase S41 n=1 Tax=Panacibacter microcysteis TaxID=2793269 RepID=A0A931GVP3_9BACT|nr:S41 family peptidase [Panacibacter microcysteis]MBG9375298.1 peptidase S41 [Panacibacter microcysteis]